jgi:hypothetical protein
LVATGVVADVTAGSVLPARSIGWWIFCVANTCATVGAGRGVAVSLVVVFAAPVRM